MGRCVGRKRRCRAGVGPRPSGGLVGGDDLVLDRRVVGGHDEEAQAVGQPGHEVIRVGGRVGGVVGGEHVVVDDGAVGGGAAQAGHHLGDRADGVSGGQVVVE